METIRLTVKNYRCFSDQDPLCIEIGPGLTAIVGPNNSGKSAIKLLFYELRHLFSLLANPLTTSPNLGAIFTPQRSITVTYQGITDHDEIFTNDNERPITLELELIPPKNLRSSPRNDNLVRIVATCQRSAPTSWNLDGYGHHAPTTPLRQRVSPPPSVVDSYNSAGAIRTRCS